MQKEEVSVRAPVFFIFAKTRKMQRKRNWKGSGTMKKQDIHCHILPNLDDGPRTMQESMKLLKMARRQNISSLIATPHYSVQFENDDPQKIQRLCKLLEEKAQEVVDPQMRIYPGQEIFYSEDILKKLDRGELLTLAGSRYILVEFLPQVLYSQLYRVTRDLVLEGYRPILAHIERYGALREPGRVEELEDIGAYLQMNYRRIGGKWYEETTRWCRKMLKEEKIHFLATDMHDLKYRYPATTDAEVWMYKHLERKYMKKICFQNADNILQNKKI